MSFKIYWTPSAQHTFSDEIDFILLKWNEPEVVKFITLVDGCLTKLQAFPYLGPKAVHKYL